MKRLYAGVPLFDDCYDVIKKLNDMYDIYVCTDFVWIMKYLIQKMFLWKNMII